MKSVPARVIFLFALLLTACTHKTCPPERLSYMDPPYPVEVSNPVMPQIATINGQEIEVDEIISGPLCNDTWAGTVYVTCDLQIPAWEEESIFLRDCSLNVDEDAIVFVEAHGDQPYFEGCSCHE